MLVPFSPYEERTLLLLGRMVRLRGEYEHVLGEGDWRMILLRKCLWSVWNDCLALGLDGPAKKMIRGREE